VIENAVGKFGLSHRSIASLKKIARTIADLSAHESIEKSDILEALSYRRRK
jgi:magnesium chelatase family protein